MSYTLFTSSLSRSAALISSMTLVSRILGLIRDMAIAWLLGGSIAAEALVIAMRIPHIVRRLFAEGSLSMGVTAQLIQLSHTVQLSSDTAAFIQCSTPIAEKTQPNTLIMVALIRALHWRLAIILGGMVTVAWLLAEPCIFMLAPAASEAILEQAVPLFRICLPYAIMATLASLGMGLLHSLQRFFIPTLAPILFNCTVLVAAICAAYGLGSATHILAWGILIGGFAQWAIQRLAIAHLWGIAGKISISGRHVWSIARNIPYSTLGAATPQLVMLCTTAAASVLPSGSIPALYYAERLLELPLGLLTIGLTMASVPILSRLVIKKDYTTFSLLTGTAIRWSLLLTLPAAMGLAALAEPVISLLLEHGAFDKESVQVTTLALLGYLPTLPACGITRALLAACHALDLTHLSLRSALLSAISAGVIVIFFLTVDEGHTNILSLTLCTSAVLWIQPLYLWYTLNRKLHYHKVKIPICYTAILQMGIAATGTGYIAYLLSQGISPLWNLCMAISAGIISYALLLLLLRNRDALDIFRRLRLW